MAKTISQSLPIRNEAGPFRKGAVRITPTSPYQDKHRN
jgi:hypothetical protein